MKIGPKRINPGTGRLVQNKGKGGGQELLPSRHAMNTLTGDPFRRSMNDYAKATPSGHNMTYADLFGLGQAGVDVAAGTPARFRR